MYQEKINEETINKAFQFGSMITDFMIRFLGFSLIKSSGQNIIITSSLNPLKQFEELLSQGYSLENRAKLYYKDGLFYKLPVLPTPINDYNYVEIIETTENKFERILK